MGILEKFLFEHFLPMSEQKVWERWLIESINNVPNLCFKLFEVLIWPKWTQLQVIGWFESSKKHKIKHWTQKTKSCKRGKSAPRVVKEKDEERVWKQENIFLKIFHWKWKSDIPLELERYPNLLNLLFPQRLVSICLACCYVNISCIISLPSCPSSPEALSVCMCF